MKYVNVDDIKASITEIPDDELVELLHKYGFLNDLVMYYLIQAEIVDRFIKNVEVQDESK